MTAEQIILLLARTVARLENALGSLEAENAALRAQVGTTDEAPA